MNLEVDKIAAQIGLVVKLVERRAKRASWGIAETMHQLGETMHRRRGAVDCYDQRPDVGTMHQQGEPGTMHQGAPGTMHQR